MFLVGSVNMELLTEFDRPHLPFYKHGTPVGVQQLK